MKTFQDLCMSKKAWLFDVDGTLIDSNDLHAEAWVKALSQFGKPIGFKELRPWIGMGGDKILNDLVGIDEQSAEARAISKHRAEFFKNSCLPRIKAFPKAAELLQSLKSRKVLTAIATSAQKDELAHLLKSTQLDGIVAFSTTSDDAKASKPDPDIIAAALQKGGIDPRSAIMIGDTPYDVAASLACGVEVIAVRTGGWDDKALKGAAMIVDDIAALFGLLQSLV